MLGSIKRFIRDETGLETVEWAIVGGIIAAVGAVVFFTIGTSAGRGINSLDGATSFIP